MATDGCVSLSPTVRSAPRLKLVTYILFSPPFLRRLPSFSSRFSLVHLLSGTMEKLFHEFPNDFAHFAFKNRGTTAVGVAALFSLGRVSVLLTSSELLKVITGEFFEKENNERLWIN